MNKINNEIPIQHRIRHLKSELGYRFSEKILFAPLLKNIFVTRSKAFDEVDLKRESRKFTPDGIAILENNKMLLFESKDFLINARVKESLDLEKWLGEVKSKVYEALDSTGTIKNKAIKQLLHNAKLIIEDEEFLRYHNLNKQQLIIYPILVVHNTQYSAPGFNKILNSWYQEARGEHAKEIKDKTRPLVIICIDTLIFYEKVFLKPNLLIETVETYIKGFYEYVRGGGDEQSLLKKNISFDDYCAETLQVKLKALGGPSPDNIVEYLARPKLQTTTTLIKGKKAVEDYDG